MECIAIYMCIILGLILTSSKSHQPNRHIASFASKLVVSTVNRLQVEDSVPLLCDECGGLPRCFSKPPHSKYARIATLYSYFLFTCCYLVVMHLFPPYFPWNKLRHPSECTILMAVFKNSSRLPHPGHD